MFKKHAPDMTLWVTRLLFLLCVACIFAILIAKPIELANSDIGRHLKNGELFMTNGLIANTNLYSYTHTDFPFVNHHWGSGVVLYLVQQLTGWTGLSLFFIALSLTALLIFFRLAWKKSSFETAALFFLVFAPMVASRAEVRPEAISYVLFALFTAILMLQRDEHYPLWTLFSLPLLMIVWVNMHIYFFLGFAVMGAFFLETLFRTPRSHWFQNTRVRTLFLVLLGSCVAIFLNPFGWRGALAPLQIFQNFGYKLAENQSFLFLETLGAFPLGALTRIAFVAIGLAWAIAVFRTWKHQKEFPVAIFIVSLFVTGMGFFAIRNLAVFGLFSVLAASTATSDLYHLLDDQLPRWWQRILAYPLLILVALMLYTTQQTFIDATLQQSSTGLQANTLEVGKFLNDHNIQGPLMNNYDIGSELIYAVYPRLKVFVDNRPEAYPADFFEKMYVPMQEDDAVWKQTDEKYGFNAIVFYRHDLTPWGQNFLIRRTTQDPNWAPVYVDAMSIILLKRNDTNKAVIEQFELPKSMFQVTQS